jgi:RND superfamily putative drug exporter
VFGVGMDYEVFLLSRVAEERKRGARSESAIVEGLARSADVITRAAAIMTGVFVAFAMSDLVIVKLIGFTLAVAIVLDATLIRLMVAPALLRLAWRWNWWPGEGFNTRTQPENESQNSLARSTP